MMYLGLLGILFPILNIYARILIGHPVAEENSETYKGRSA